MTKFEDEAREIIVAHDQRILDTGEISYHVGRNATLSALTSAANAHAIAKLRELRLQAWTMPRGREVVDAEAIDTTIAELEASNE